MRYNIAFKFLAVALCALMLLAALAGGFGILALLEGGLFDKTVAELREEKIQNSGLGFAGQVAAHYADSRLGLWPEELEEPDWLYGVWGDYGDWFSGVFNPEKAAYTLKDAEGNVLEQAGAQTLTDPAVFTFPVSGSYKYVLSVEPKQEPEETAGAPEYFPEDGALVYEVTFSFRSELAGDGSIGTSGVGDPIGVLTHNEAGVLFLRMESFVGANLPEDSVITSLELLGENGAVLYRAEDRAGVGEFVSSDEMTDVFRIGPTAEEGQTQPAAVETTPDSTIPAETEPEVVTEGTVPSETTVPFETPVVPVFTEERVRTAEYWDEDAQQTMVVTYRYARMPNYTMELRVAPGGYRYDETYPMLELLQNNRNVLFVAVGAGLLLFAMLAVYLCCAAGRKPGTDVVRAGGLNRVPLDLYAFLVILGVGCIGVVFVEEADYLLELERTLALSIVGYGGFSCALMIVGFCFAFAAQVKTPEYFWWRNSLCGRVFSLFILACRWCWKQWLRVWHWLPKAMRWVWNLAARIFRACWKLVLWTWNLVMGILGTVWGFVARCGKACGRWIGRMYGMLPLVWQWLVAIPLLFFLLLINIGSASPAGILLRMGIVLLATVYLASAFGTLLAGARRMCDGDLGTKVDDKMLVGCFREFADSLNGLSDAALVAAREQLKSERMRTELITNVSHDIKTPLTSIINYVDLLQYPHTPEQEKEYLAVLSRQSARMKKLIDDLMEMSKAASGSLPVEITQVDAGEAINQALGEFADKLAAADLTPVFRQPEEPILMMADGRLAWRAMSNLLSNAVKYALPGTRLYIDLSRAGSSVMISMKNISREQLNVSADELMERFVRGDTSRNTEGSGLGLNIAKSLMELQKGQLQLLVDGDLFKATLIFPGV